MNSANRLVEILNKSKEIMIATEQKHGHTSNSRQSGEFGGEEKEIPNLTENFVNKHKSVNKSVAPVNGRYRNIENSKLPDSIKKAMIDHPIEIPETPFHTFELEDVPSLVETTKQKNVISENTNNISENKIRKIVREEMEGLVRKVIEEYFDKSLMTEEIQIKVGNTTFSGNLKPLPQKRK